MARLWVTLICALMVACTGAETASGQPSSEDGDRLLALLRDPFDPPIQWSVPGGDALEKVEKRFGSPLRRAERVATSPRDPTVTFAYVTLEYDGLRFEFFGPPAEDARQIGSVELRSSSYLLKFGLRIGATRTQIGEALRVEMPPRGVPYIASKSYSVPAGDFRAAVFPKITVLFDDSDRVEQMIFRFDGH